jgi:hypothetical protein
VQRAHRLAEGIRQRLRSLQMELDEAINVARRKTGNPTLLQVAELNPATRSGTDPPVMERRRISFRTDPPAVPTATPPAVPTARQPTTPMVGAGHTIDVRVVGPTAVRIAGSPAIRAGQQNIYTTPPAVRTATQPASRKVGADYARQLRPLRKAVRWASTAKQAVRPIQARAGCVPPHCRVIRLWCVVCA